MAESSESQHTPRHFAEPGCVVRIGEPCRLCQPGASGPHDCQLAYLVLDDEELRSELEERLRRAEGADGSAG